MQNGRKRVKRVAYRQCPRDCITELSGFAENDYYNPNGNDAFSRKVYCIETLRRGIGYFSWAKL